MGRLQAHAGADRSRLRELNRGSLRIDTQRRLLPSGQPEGSIFLTGVRLHIGLYRINTLTCFFLTWFPVYLVKERGLSILQAGFDRDRLYPRRDRVVQRRARLRPRQCVGRRDRLSVHRRPDRTGPVKGFLSPPWGQPSPGRSHPQAPRIWLVCVPGGRSFARLRRRRPMRLRSRMRAREQSRIP